MGIMKHSLEKIGMMPVEGGDIHYRFYCPHDSLKSARTPLIIVHGGPGSTHLAMYDSLNRLADERPVLFYDQLGSHFSPAKMTPDLMRLERFSDEIKHLMDGLELKKAYLLGYSWGAAVSTKFTVDNQEKVAGLILSGPHLSTSRWIDDCNRLLSNLPVEIQDIISRCEGEGTTDSEEYRAADKFFSNRHYLRCDPWPVLVQAHRNKLNRDVYNIMWGPSEFSCSGLLKDMDLFPCLLHITVPTQFICGEFDMATPETVAEMQALVKGSSLTVIPNSGHMSFVDSNESYLSAVHAFFNELQENNIALSQAQYSSKPAI